MAKSRTPDPKEDGPIVKAIKEAMRMRPILIEGGMAAHEVDRVVGEGLKQAFQEAGAGRAEPWKYYCQDCHDCGWVSYEAIPEREPYGPGVPARYARKCDHCRYWAKQAEAAQKESQRRIGGDEFSVIGATKRPYRR